MKKIVALLVILFLTLVSWALSYIICEIGDIKEQQKEIASDILNINNTLNNWELTK